MSMQKAQIESYFELTEHSLVQKIIFTSIFAIGIIVVFSGILLPLMNFLFKVYLEGIVYNRSDMILPDLTNSDKHREINYFMLWAIDIYKNTPQEARYWFEPVTSLLIPSAVFGAAASIIVTTLMPSKFGFMRQKIEREIANFISKIEHSESKNISDEIIDIEQAIISADLRTLFRLSEKWGINIDELKTLRKALIWKNANLLKKIIYLNDGLTMYMRYYFTVKYGNAILGFVYIGAAVLIIIIGLRGLKFIPSTQPSLVFFALGLEFSLLITYAFTLMYGKQEDESITTDTSDSTDELQFFSSAKSSNSIEAEKLLRVFLKTSKKDLN